jgi:hypothetical protein
MRSQTRTRRNVYVVAITAAALLTLLLVDAFGKSGTQVDSGQSRELINRPACWTPENPDDISRCELDDYPSTNSRDP